MAAPNPKAMLKLYYLSIFIILHCANGGKVSNPKEDIIHFPGKASVDKFDVSAAIKTDCIAGFCSNVENYPKQDVEKLVENNPSVKAFFENDFTPEISQRGQFDSGDLEETLCEANVRWSAPEAANNTDNVTRLIVQRDVKQFVYIEQCNKNASCKFKSSFPNNYEVYCKQKYSLKRLAIISDNNTIYWDTFDVPCCCVCALKRI